MTRKDAPPIDVLVLALPETAGSALYGLVDVLMAAGNLWQTLTRDTESRQVFRVRIVSPQPAPFACGNGIPVRPDVAIGDEPAAPIVIVPELWLRPDEVISGRHPQVVQWLRRRYRDGATLYSACSGAAMLAETGLLDGYCATSHWGYRELFRKHYPKVRFDPAPNLVFARADGRIVTAGGTTSWHDLALHIIGRHASPGEALRIAKVYLMKWHSEGQLPYAPLLVEQPHGDAVVRRCEAWLRKHWLDADAVARAAAAAGIAERTLERRFKAATGCSLLGYLQNLRIEEAKRRLEDGSAPIDEISEACGYGDASFFRRLFKRLTGLTPGQYRRMFSGVPGAMPPPPGGGAGNTLRHSK